MADLHLTSLHNPRVKALLALSRRRVRDAEGLTVVEGHDELALAVEAGVRPHTFYYCPELAPPLSAALVKRIRALSAPVVRLSREVFERVAYREGPDGFLATVPSPGMSLARLPLSARPFLLVCEGIEKPGNLGAMLRTAEAAGVEAVIAADSVTDWGNPNVVRASKGTVFSVPVARATLAETLSWLQAHGIPLVATTPDTDAVHTEVDYRGPVALAVGAESTGLTDAALAAAAHRVRIPMAGHVNSLNAATAAAIVIYEVVRQRSGEST